MRRINTFTGRLAAVALIALSIAAPVHAADVAAPATPAPGNVCQQALQSLKSEWKVVAYPTAEKPTEMRVEGKYGHENSAAQIAYMKEEMKKADSDCRSGNQQAALQRVSSVQDMLDAHGISAETANAAMIQKQQ
jgi:hypothetical protein